MNVWSANAVRSVGIRRWDHGTFLLRSMTTWLPQVATSLSDPTRLGNAGPSQQDIAGIGNIHSTFYKKSFQLRSLSTKAESKDKEPQLSYFDRKRLAKEARTTEFEERLQRQERRRHRRVGSPKDVLKGEFKEWWDKRKAFEQMMERRARKAGMEWMIQVAVILERLPIVLPDKEEWEKEFDDLQTYLNQFGKEFPKEFVGERIEEVEEPVFTEEELLGK